MYYTKYVNVHYQYYYSSQHQGLVQLDAVKADNAELARRC